MIIDGTPLGLALRLHSTRLVMEMASSKEHRMLAQKKSCTFGIDSMIGLYQIDLLCLIFTPHSNSVKICHCSTFHIQRG
jgi:hypothetical protein